MAGGGRVEAVRSAVGTRIAVTAKLNMQDGVRGGFDLEESIAFARMLEADGMLDALELTAGSSPRNPMYLFRGDAPVAEFAANFPWLQSIGAHSSKSEAGKPMQKLETVPRSRSVAASSS